jgi:ribosomal protein L9
LAWTQGHHPHFLRAMKDKLFGSIGTHDIAEALTASGVRWQS